MKAITWIFLAAGLYQMAAFVSAEDNTLSITHPARAFGYTIGDVLEQTIELQAGETTHTLQALPDIQREGRWIARRNVVLTPDGQRLIIRYQIINSPPDVRLVSLPALNLETAQGERIDIPEWSFSLAPLTPTGLPDENGLPVMQADWKPELPPATTRWRNIKTLSAALMLLLTLWLVWWLIRGMREASTLPFAHAYRTIRRHKSHSANEDAPNWLALHRAFDQMAGRSVNSGSINALVNSVDWLEPFNSDISTFYRLSSERFFASSTPDVSSDFDLAGFSKRLYRAEKQHTSKLPEHSLAAHEMS